MFDFSDRNSVLFEWNKDVDERPEGIFEEDILLYLSLAAETPGVVLERHQPIPSLEYEIEPQGRAENAAAQNANLEPINVAGLDTPTIIHDNANELYYSIYDNDGIISIATISRDQDDPHPLVLDDTTEGGDEDEDKESDDDDDEDNDEEDNDEEMIDNEDTAEAKESGVRRSMRNNKGKNEKYKDYALMMTGRRQARGQKRATINHQRWVRILLSGGSERCQARARGGQGRVDLRSGTRTLLHDCWPEEVQGGRRGRRQQGAETDARHGSVPTHGEGFTIEGGKDQGGRVSNVPQGEEGSLGESEDVRRRAEAEG